MVCGKLPSASVVHHEGDGERLFHSRTLSVTTRRSSQIHPSLSAQRAPTRATEVQTQRKGITWSRLVNVPSAEVCHPRSSRGQPLRMAGAPSPRPPRNYPGSCSQREPKRRKGDPVRSSNLRGVVCGALGPVSISLARPADQLLDWSWKSRLKVQQLGPKRRDLNTSHLLVHRAHLGLKSIPLVGADTLS